MAKIRLGNGSALALAINEINSQYNVDVTIIGKAKTLHKWGHVDSSASGSWETVQGGGGVETLLTANSITVVDSTSASDTETVSIEGHYLAAGGDLVFHIQSATLTGTTAVTLSQPMARVSRINITSSELAVGTITVNAGEGGTAYAEIEALHASTEKAATTTSYRDYLIIEAFGSSILGGNNASVSFRLQIEEYGGVWRTIARWSLKGDSTDYDRDVSTPPLIIEPNTDIRIQSNASLAGTQVTAHFDGDFAINKAYINDASPAPA